jgi:hypothetical protein
MTRKYPLWGDGRRYGDNAGSTIEPDELNYRNNYDIQRASSFGRDRGVALTGSFAKALFNYSAGAFNGAGINLDNDNRDLLFSARVWSDLLGQMSPSMTDLHTSESPLVSIGAAFAYDLPRHLDERDPKVEYNSEDFNVTFDALFKWLGISALAAGFYRHSDHGAVFGNDPIQTMGLTGQIAYFNEQTGLEPAARYSVLDENVDLSKDQVHEITGAVNYYVFGQNLKLQLEYRGIFPQDKDKSYLAPYGVWLEDRHEITLMVQMGF